MSANDPLAATSPAHAWTAFQDLCPNAPGAVNPSVRTDAAGNTYAAWSAGPDTNGKYMIGFAARPAGGAWCPAKNIWPPSPARYAFPDLATRGKMLYLAFVSTRDGGQYVYFTRSANGGTTWTRPAKISAKTQRCAYPAIAVDPNSGTFYVAYNFGATTFENIGMVSSTDGGVTWDENTFTKISTKPPRSTAKPGAARPRIAVDASGRIHVVWEDSLWKGRWSIAYRRLDPDADWSDVQIISGDSGGDHDQFPDIAVSGENVYVVWHFNNAGQNSRIGFRASADHGVTWPNATIKLSGRATQAQRPRIVIESNGNVGVVYENGKFVQFRERAAKWSPLLNIAVCDGRVETVALAADGADNLFALWRKRMDPNGSMADIFASMRPVK